MIYCSTMPLLDMPKARARKWLSRQTIQACMLEWKGQTTSLGPPFGITMKTYGLEARAKDSQGCSVHPAWLLLVPNLRLEQSCTEETLTRTSNTFELMSIAQQLHIATTTVIP